MTKQTIILTGPDGYIGSALKQFFRDKYETYRVFELGRKQCNLLDKETLREEIEKIERVRKDENLGQIDWVVHCAAVGGRRTEKRAEHVLYQNLVMFQNLVAVLEGNYKNFLNIDSGASLDRRSPIVMGNEYDMIRAVPEDPYGLSKNIIAKFVRMMPGGCNIRLFGCFDENEEETRLIKSAIRNKLEGREIKLHQDREFDFIYMKDFLTLVDSLLRAASEDPDFTESINDINAVYRRKHTLGEIVRYINNLGGKSPVKIIAEDENEGLSYTGAPNLNCLVTDDKLIGLSKGIKETYKILKQRLPNLG